MINDINILSDHIIPNFLSIAACSMPSGVYQHRLWHAGFERTGPLGPCHLTGVSEVEVCKLGVDQ